ncbi:MAG: arylsulfatase [Alphaproteobacteria bacterium]|nr:arylsulfatase [Alphaproteobacteria bacterium]
MDKKFRKLIWVVCLYIGVNITQGICETQSVKQRSDQTQTNNRPNILLFYVDDLGYGDIGINGAKGVNTPNIDALARAGLNFSDAHSTAATCTPSRYALLTGEHGFRIKSDILEGDAPALIAADRPTLPKMLKKAGYRSAIIGKWHLGLGKGNIDWNKEISPGPIEAGFDYSFIIPVTGDRVPTVFLENHKVVSLDASDPISISYDGKIGSRPLGSEKPDLLQYVADPQHSGTIINGVSRIGSMAGGESALWVDENIPSVLNEKAKIFIQDAGENPFFLFYSFHDIHVPRMPHPDFKGMSSMGPRGDVIAQVDWTVGEILNELDRLGLADNTLVLFTSDNGPVLNDGYKDGAVERLGDHKPGGPYRGGKYSAYEAGTRVPTIIRWTGTVKVGKSDALLSQVDLYASLAEMFGVELEANEAIDSQAFIDAFLGKNKQGRTDMIEESVATISLRIGDWKYIEQTPQDLITRSEWVATDKAIDGGFKSEPQLYNLRKDPAETTNVAIENPDIFANMKKRLDALRTHGFR